MSRRIIYAVIILVIILILAIIWWQRPTRVVNSALNKLSSAQTQKFTADVSITNEAASQSLIGEQAQVQLVLNGAFERRADTRDSLAADIDLTTGTEGLTLKVAGATRFVDDEAYFQITKSPQAFPLLVALKEKWIQLPRGGDDATATPTESKLFSQVSRVGSEKIGDRSTTKYTAQATAEAVVSMLDGIADLLGTRLTTDQVDGIRQSAAEIDSVAVDLWVTPWSHELVRLATSLTIPGSNTITLVLDVSDRNQPTEITVPTEAVTFEQALQPPS